jgi:CheY-like chemotaxis protein
LAREGTDVELAVSDNGLGIDPQFLPHVFERFRQAEGSTTRRFGGLGLGLALVRHLIEAHGGTVRAESAGLGAGCTFRARLPVQAVFAAQAESVRPSAVPTPRPQVSGIALAGVRVLVVDDEADARDLVATVLRGSGAEVTVAASAAEALEHLASQMPMLLLSDVGMPETDGYELIRRVRSQLGPAGATLPAIALTAYAREEDRRLALAAGFHAHVSKPVEPADLLQLVASLATPHALTGDRTSPLPAGSRADTFVKLERILAGGGIHEALRFLNSRTPHRFTGIHRFDGDVLRSLHLFDSEQPQLLRGDDAPLEESYCSLVGASERSFTTADARQDDRLRGHPARDRVVSYCGVLLRDASGESFGTLCHFDRVACDVPTSEMPLLESAALSLMRSLLRSRRNAG